MRRSNRSLLILVLGLAATLPVATAPRLARADEEPPRLDAVPFRIEANSFRAVGFDPAAPRPLVLWRWDGERFFRVATTRSQTWGRFDFGQQPIPSGDAYFHVSAVGALPDPDRLLHVERRTPAPVIQSGGLETGELVLVPARLEGELWIRDADSGRLLLRKAVDPRARYRVWVDLDDELPRPWPRALEIEQRLDDGRASESEILPLEPRD